MPLQQQIDQDIRQAMIAHDAAKLSTLRFLKSALKYAAIDKKVDVLGDVEIQQIIQKQIKQRKESIDQFVKGNRKDLAEKEIQEAAILENYLPKQLSDSELDPWVRQEVSKAGAVSKKDFGNMMKLLSEKCAGRASAKRISEVLGKILVN